MEAKGHTPVAMEKDREAKRGRFEVCCMLSVCVYVCIVCIVYACVVCMCVCIDCACG